MKNLNSYFFSSRFFSLCLVFFISFSIFSFGFFPRKVVKANPLVGVAEEEVVSIVVNILSSFGVVVSIPTASDFLEQEKDFCTQKALELQNHKGAVTKGIQALQEGYYVSKEFCQKVLNEWEEYSVKKKLTSSICSSYVESMCQIPSPFDNDEQYLNYTNSLVSCFSGVVVNSSSFEFYYHNIRSNKWELIDEFYSSTDYQRCMFGVPLQTSYAYYKEPFSSANYFNFNGYRFSFGRYHYDGFKLVFGDYQSKVSANKQVIDNTLNPVNEKNQGIVISPQNVEAVGKVLNPTIPDVKDSQITVDVPISSVASTVPKVVSGADVGALPWGDVGSIDKPVDKPIDNPVDKPIDKPIDKPVDKPIDKPVDKPIDKPLDKPTDKIDFTPFISVSENIKESFPFCIPWDIANGFKTLLAPEKAPVFDINFDQQYFSGGGSLHIDLTQFESIAKIFRFFIMLTFSICIVILTRNVIGGN